MRLRSGRNHQVSRTYPWTPLFPPAAGQTGVQLSSSTPPPAPPAPTITEYVARALTETTTRRYAPAPPPPPAPPKPPPQPGEGVPPPPPPPAPHASTSAWVTPSGGVQVPLAVNSERPFNPVYAGHESALVPVEQLVFDVSMTLSDPSVVL